ncbi:MAG: macro domain-containing protein [Armatimonadota bacterium]|nr:macro domain-containing protein [Armatimonadota bacterium]MDR7466749.1 macro domain-containing protein [Armatimonadota bacterium]MDR7492777.1 macro domain-containing protein [Armatimonadota bacterium]MDR7498553.1 macro domain-containing protein [Armatimonadota bacterium]MDR7504332.1 macro domain-containing protein [Armatimonadota bacterium]
MERRIGRTVLSVHQGDITRLQVDAIVNAANTHLWMGGGVAGAIKRAGGVEIEREAVRLGPVAVGEAVATHAGRLPCRHVIHAATMGPDLVTSAEAIRNATRSSLRLADALGLTSLAFPLLGTGVGGFPPQEAARLMVAETVAYLQGGSSLAAIVFVGFTAEAAEALARAVEEA